MRKLFCIAFVGKKMRGCDCGTLLTGRLANPTLIITHDDWCTETEFIEAKR